MANDESWHKYKFGYSGGISQEKWDKAFGKKAEETKIKCSKCDKEFGSIEELCVICLQEGIAFEYLKDLDIMHNAMLC